MSFTVDKDDEQSHSALRHYAEPILGGYWPGEFFSPGDCSVAENQNVVCVKRVLTAISKSTQEHGLIR